MSNTIRFILMVATFLGGLAGFAWAVSSTRGYPFGNTLLAEVSIYVVLLLT